MFVQKFIRYFIESLVICVVALYIPKINLDIKEILMIAFSGTFTLMILDLYAPNVGIFLRHGLGSVLGFKNIIGKQLKGGNLFSNIVDKLSYKIVNVIDSNNEKKGGELNDNLTIITSKIDEIGEKAKNIIGLQGGNNNSNTNNTNNSNNSNNNNNKILCNNNNNLDKYINMLKSSI